MKFSEKEVELLQEAGARAEKGIEYTKENIKVFRNDIVSYIMNHSKNEIPEVSKRFNMILQKIG